MTALMLYILSFFFLIMWSHNCYMEMSQYLFMFVEFTTKVAKIIECEQSLSLNDYKAEN